MATPCRGEVWLIVFGMAGKTRPALIVSVAFGDQDRALITAIPHTTLTVPPESCEEPAHGLPLQQE